MGKTLDQLKPEQLDAVLHQAVDFVSDDKKKAAIANVMSTLTTQEKQKLLDYAIMEKYGLNEKSKAHNHANHSGHNHDSHAGHNHGTTPNPTAKVATPAAPVGPTTVMTLDETVFDFGVIEEGEKISHVYTITNTGKEPLIIKNAKGSCGCTVPTYEKAPILPGESSEIKIRYATNRLGKINKTVTLYTNEGDDAKRVIKVVGMVNKKAPQPEAVPAAAPTILSSPNGKGQ